jgi:hypothetical protein
VIASTATVRRAREQVQALFGRHRSMLSMFPPPGPNEADTWFAYLDEKSPGRLYVGVAAPGRSMKGILLRTYVDLLCSAQHEWNPKTQDADPFMTLAGYFNSLRELGGMRRLVEDDVRSQCAQRDTRLPVGFSGTHPWFRGRTVAPEPVELTSRENTSRIATAKERLNRAFTDGERVDVLLASNMISVGVDIDRLGLMVVAGQPKTTSEYIQASSRVGRAHPGLVVTCFNVRKPRDRSHFERFAAYHGSFYRFVEANSLTPFSGPALERGLAGTLVAMARLGNPPLSAPRAAMLLEKHRKHAERAVDALAARGAMQPDLHGKTDDKIKEALVARGRDLLDAWERIVQRLQKEAGGELGYSKWEWGSPSKNLLYSSTMSEPEDHDEAKFAAPTSMRDVEASVHLWIAQKRLGGKK